MKSGATVPHPKKMWFKVSKVNKFMCLKTLFTAEGKTEGKINTAHLAADIFFKRHLNFLSC